ncbi:MAG: site-specific integrase [Bryobacteraceae bacterium]|nr:site-specific integrase [Bryobacteraceae bacterium]
MFRVRWRIPLGFTTHFEHPFTDLDGCEITSKRLSFARTFLHVARKHTLIDENPFSEVKIPTANVSLRQRFIDRDMVQKLLDAANPTWRAIIALARFGGLRCPSEVLSLVAARRLGSRAGYGPLAQDRPLRRQGKSHYPVVPRVAEAPGCGSTWLRKHLEEAFELAEPGQTHVIGDNHLAKAPRPTGWKSCNLRTTFGKLIKRAGLEAWPRLFHNLRSSRETELLEKFPVHVVALWMGHDAKVSLKHYAQTTDEHFERGSRAAESDALALQNAVQRPAAGSCGESQSDRVNGDGVATCATPCDTSQLHAPTFSGEGGIL